MRRLLLQSSFILLFWHIKSIQMILNIPVGLIFHGNQREFYTRLNSFALQYVFNKLERRYQYNVTELFDQENFNYADVDIWSKLCSQLSNGIMSIIGHVDYDNYHWLSGFCSTYHVPFLGLNLHQKLEDNYYLSLMPDLLPALIAFIRRYQLNQLVYIYDDIHGAQRFKQLMYMQTTNQIENLNLISRYLGNPEESYELLQNIDSITSNSYHIIYSSHGANYRHFGRYIVLDFQSFDTYRHVMDKIKHRGMTTAGYHYILLTLNAKQLDMTYFRYGGVNVTFFTLPSIDQSESNEEFFQMIGKNPSVESLLLADAWEILLRTINRMLSANNETRESLKVFRQGVFYNGLTPGINCRNNYIRAWSVGKIYLENLLNTTFQGLSGHVEFSNETGQRVNYTFDVYRVTRNELPKQIGYFKEPTTLEIADISADQLRMLYDNYTRFIVTIFDEPFMMLKKNRNDSLTEQSITAGTILEPHMVEGYCADLAYAICHERLHLPYKFIIEKKYGSEVENGVWDGMVGALVRREAHLAIASLTINGAREKAVDFSKPFINLGISIMIRKPEKQKPGVFSFMAPLSKEIWICVIISYLLVSAILYFVSRSSSYEWYFENEKDVIPRNKFNMHNSLFFSFAAFMHQGVDLLPRSVSGRIVTSAWWFFSLILVSSYTANLAAFLTVEKLVTPIETVEDLANQTEIKYGIVGGGSTENFFAKSTLTTFQKMWKFMQAHRSEVFVSNNSKGFEKVRQSKGKYAFLLESTLNEYVNERLPCDTMRVGENIDAKGYGIATPLGSDLREAINIAVLELIENGFLERLKHKWYYERSECTNIGTKDSKQSTALNLANVAGMFYVLIVGLGLAMVIAFVEFLFKARIDSKKLNQNIRDVMRRNLRISITGIDFDEKEQQQQNDYYWPLQQQQQQQQQKKTKEKKNRTSIISCLSNSTKNGETNGFHKTNQGQTSYL